MAVHVRRCYPSPVVRCPACDGLLVTGALRCRACGADARGALAAGVRSCFVLDPTPDQQRALVLLAELRDLAPAVAIWIRQDPETRGPRPDVRAADRPRLEELLAEMRDVRERLRPKG